MALTASDSLPLQKEVVNKTSKKTSLAKRILAILESETKESAIPKKGK